MATAKVRERLAALRDDYKLSDAGLARAAGLRQQDVSRFFNGDMKFPPLDFLDALARVFHLTLADVLAKDLPAPSLTNGQMQVLVSLKTMKTSERVAFEALMAQRGRRGTR